MPPSRFVWKGRGIPLLVLAEVLLIIVAIIGVGSLLYSTYYNVTANELVLPTARATEVVALIPTTTPTVEDATETPTVIVPTETSTTTPTSTPTSTFTPTPTITSTPAISRPVTVTTTVPPTTPRPTLVGNWTALGKCGVITAPGNYRLTTDLVTAGDCINVQASQVVLDCENHIIQGSGKQGAGIGVRNYGPMGITASDSVEIRNCRLKQFRWGIFVEGGRNHLIHDNNSSDNFDDTDGPTRAGAFLGMVDGGGIHIKNTSDSQVVSNTTLHQAIGIDVRNSKNMIIRANTTSGNSAWGINLHGTQNSQVLANIAADNLRTCQWGGGMVGEGCDAGGIVLQGGSSGNVINGNRVTGRNGNGIFIKAHAQPCGNNNSIVGNTISAVLYNAVELSFCTGNRITDNVMQDGMDGIWLGYAQRTEIRNNTIAGMRNHGIISLNSHDNVVSGNQIVNSNEGIFFYSEDVDTTLYAWLPFGDYKSHDNCLCSNRLEANQTVAIRLKDSTGNQVNENIFQGNGRTIILQGNSGGNTLQGNVGWLPDQPGKSLARILMFGVRYRAWE